MKKIIFILFSLISVCAPAATLPVHCDNDIRRVEEILGSLRDSNLPLGDRMVLAAKSLIGAGNDDYYLTDSVGSLRINLDSFTPIMFINNVVALARASQAPGTPDVGTFVKELENIACRRGENTGFTSIMYHSSDWIGDNLSRGNLRELTEDFEGVVPRTKSLDDMTRNRRNFAALADSTAFETVRMTEMGFRTHRVPSLKKETIKKKELIADLQNGDILILVPSRDGIDYIDMGIIDFENGVPYLIHISPQSKTVVRETEDLARYFALITKHFQGYRLIRIRN